MKAFDASGRSIPLGKELGTGGEGSVFDVADGRGFVAKIYRAPASAELSQKLATMVRQRDQSLQSFAAWPVELVSGTPGGSVSGFLMPRVTDSQEIHVLYGPKSRLTLFPTANYKFLVHTACNLARAFAHLHEKNIVIGDVNHANARVSQNALVHLIDCDSFQVTNRQTGKVYVCKVGVDTHQPPEIQVGGKFDVVRTPDHDNFGLAVLIFQLLFLGRHPYSGKYLGSGDMPIASAIIQNRFAYGAGAPSRQMQAPPGAPDLGLAVSAAPLFERAFAPPGGSTVRPTATEWTLALDALERQLATCPRNSAHYYPVSLSGCPWCALEQTAGVLLFVSSSLGPAAGSGNFQLAQVWAQIVAVPEPKPGALLPRRSSIKVSPSQNARSLGWQRRRQFAMAVVMAIVGLLAWAVGFPLQGGASFWSFAVALAFGWVIGQKAPSKAAIKQTYDSTQLEWTRFQDQWRRETGNERFLEKRRALETAKQEYEALAGERQRRFNELQQSQQQRQLKKYLNACRIEHNPPQGIGKGLVATLMSYGIETAADVEYLKVLNVPGFGETRTSSLVQWRDYIEKQFRFDPRKGVDPADVAQLDREFSTRKAEWEKLLLAGPSDLKNLAQQVDVRRQYLEPRVEQLLARLAQAAADNRAC